MWLVCESFRSVSATFAKVDRDSEASHTRRDMDGRSTCEIKPAKDKRPSIGVPRPAGDGVVDDGGPDEDENHNRAETTAFSDGTHGEGGGDGSEHKLIDAEKNGWNAGASN